MKKEIDLKIQPGPCMACGETNYPLSTSGPTICPACDCGWDLKTRLALYREQIKEFEQIIRLLQINRAEALEACIGDDIEKATEILGQKP